MRTAFEEAVAALVVDEDDDVIPSVEQIAFTYNLTPEEAKRLAEIAEGPIGP